LLVHHQIRTLRFEVLRPATAGPFAKRSWKRYDTYRKTGALIRMSTRTFLGSKLFFAVLIGALTAINGETCAVPEPGDLRAAGAVDFPVSGTPAVQAAFTRDLALLHSFFYGHEEKAGHYYSQLQSRLGRPTAHAESSANCANRSLQSRHSA
jgi:hypothetical protein